MILFSKRIKELRKSAGLTQQQLGDKLNVTKGSICCYENGTRMASVETLIQMANIFRVDLDYLIGTDDYLPAIARSIHFEKYLYLIEEEFRWKYNTDERKNNIKKYFKFLLNYEITPNERFEYILKPKQTNSKKRNDDYDF